MFPQLTFYRPSTIEICDKIQKRLETLSESFLSPDRCRSDRLHDGSTPDSSAVVCCEDSLALEEEVVRRRLHHRTRSTLQIAHDSECYGGQHPTPTSCPHYVEELNV